MSPISRLTAPLRHRHLSKRLLSTKSNVTTSTLIIGGGVMGLSTAYHLSLLRPSPASITIIEKDPSYQYASSALSAGGMRQQFSLRENIKMSLYGRDFLRSAVETLGVDVGFREEGYLFLACSEEGKETMLRNWRTQKESGCEDIVLLEKEDLKKRFDWLNVDDVLMGSYGEKGEGWFDPWVLMKGLKEKSLEKGVDFVKGEVVSAKRDRSGKLLSVDVNTNNGLISYTVENVVNATGPSAETVMSLLAGSDRPLNHPLPVKPRKRCIYFFHSSSPDTPPITPLTIDPNNVYFRSEGPDNHFICGAPPPIDSDWEYGNYSSLDRPDPSFTNSIWPVLYDRVPGFDTIKIKSSWCGLYEYNVLDQNGIIGFHPEIENVLLINGFSGHGVQQAPAAGRSCAELLERGKFETLDLSRMSFERFLTGDLLFEDGIV